MSNPKEIDQFDAQVKRTSERLRGGSASPPDTQSKETNPEENVTQASVGTAQTPSTVSSSTQTRRGKTTGKKGAQPAATPGTSTKNATMSNAVGGEASNPDLREGLTTTPGVTARAGVSTAETTTDAPTGALIESGLQANSATGTNPTQGIDARATRTATTASPALIAPKIIRRNVDGSARCKRRVSSSQYTA